MRHHNFVKTIDDLDRFYDTQQAILVQDSQEIESISEYVAQDLSDYGCLFVIVGDGDYVSIWGCDTSIPWLGESLDRILWKH